MIRLKKTTLLEFGIFYKRKEEKMTQSMTEASNKLFEDLRDEGLPLVFGKKTYAEIEGITQSSVNSKICSGDVPVYSKMGGAKNSPVRFMLRDVCDFIASKRIQIA